MNPRFLTHACHVTATTFGADVPKLPSIPTEPISKKKELLFSDDFESAELGNAVSMQLADKTLPLFFPAAPPLSMSCVLNQRSAEINSLIISDAFRCRMSGADCPA